MLYALITAWLNISQIRRICGGMNTFARGDKCQASYDSYLMNVYITKWIDNLVPTDGLVVVSESLLGVSSSNIARD